MRKSLLKILLILLVSNTALSEEKFNHLGSFKNIRATDTGHCYGTSISIWELNDKKIIGLLSVHTGLCGDPPCSILQGSIKINEISFKTNYPIYNVHYSFSGKITNDELSGQLNNESIILKSYSYNPPYKNIERWCVIWSKISRCRGVKEYCR